MYADTYIFHCCDIMMKFYEQLDCFRSINYALRPTAI